MGAYWFKTCHFGCRYKTQSNAQCDISVPAASLPAGNHGVHKSNTMIGRPQDADKCDEKKKEGRLGLVWGCATCTLKLNFNPQRDFVASDSRNCVKGNLDASQQKSEGKSGKRRHFWPVAFQLFSPIVLKSFFAGKKSKNKENIGKEDNERNCGGKVEKWGGQFAGKFVRLQKRDTWPNTFKLTNPIWKIDLVKWVSKVNAKTIKMNQEPTSYLSFCYLLISDSTSHFPLSLVHSALQSVAKVSRVHH